MLPANNAKTTTIVIMKNAINIEFNTILIFIFSIIGLLIIDLFLVPAYIGKSYLYDFRANNPEGLYNLISFAIDYNQPKVYFIGDSVFWASGLSRNETIAARFERCDPEKRQAFNLALKGSRLNDLALLVNLTQRDALIILEVNPLGLQGNIHQATIQDFTKKEPLNFSFPNHLNFSFPNLYHHRYTLQNVFFEGSTKEKLYKYYETFFIGNLTPTENPGLVSHFNAPTPTIVSEELKAIDPKNILFVIVPIYNSSFNSTPLHYGNYLDFSQINQNKDYFLDYQHLSKKGATYIAEEICEAVSS